MPIQYVEVRRTSKDYKALKLPPEVYGTKNLECGCVVTTEFGHKHTKLCDTHHTEVFTTVWSGQDLES